MSENNQPENLDKKPKSKVWGVIRDIAETVIISLAIFLIIYIFLVQPNKVDGPSMFPTLIHDQYILTDKVSYRFSKPQRGDVVVFHAPKVACNSATMGNCLYIKRLIGLPGDMVKLDEGRFYVNGELLDESYLPEGIVTIGGNYINDQEVKLADNEYFVVGDNRSDSSDSRLWGPITRDAIVGRAFFSYRPLNRFGTI